MTLQVQRLRARPWRPCAVSLGVRVVLGTGGGGGQEKQVSGWTFPGPNPMPRIPIAALEGRHTGWSL